MSKKLIPELRFPEFSKNGEWYKTSLNKISSSIFDGTHQTPKYTDKGIPFFSVENIVSGSKNKFISREDHIYETRNNKPEFGDVLITRIGAIGIPKVVDWKYEFSIYVTLAVIKKSDKFDSNYLAAYIQSSRFQGEIRRRSLLKAAPQKINMNELRKCEVLLPPKYQEQQKIAACLSSLDELIAAHTDKLNALKDHKKGLMLILFPQEGETVPKVRFPEFQGDGEWEEDKLGERGEFVGGGTPSKSNLEFWEGEFPWVSSSDIAEDSIHHINIARFITAGAIKESATKIVPANSLLIVSRVGVGKVAVSKEEISTSQDFLNFTPQKDDPVFLGYYLKRNQNLLLSFSQGMAIKGFTKDDISRLSLRFPPKEEQQKIASCLSAVDELITAQQEKIDQLQQHKKGLMQGLFPNPSTISN